MKHLKIIGLAAVAAMAITAFAAASASASELCSTNTSPCTGTMYMPGTAVSASSTSAVLTTSGGLVNPTVTCKKSSTGGETTTTGGVGTTVNGSLSSLTFSECTHNLASPPENTCTATAVNLPYLAKGTATGGGNGTLKVESGGKGNPGAKVECKGLPTCTYSAASVTLDVTGGNPATVVANKEALSGGAFPCPPNAQWTATYTVNAPKPVFLVNP
jgi:hypothetical protein